MAVALEQARLNTALHISHAMGTDVEAWKMMREFTARDSSGSLVIVAAAPEESFALTLHRMRETGQKSVVLAVDDGSFIRLRQFDAVSSAAVPRDVRRHDLSGGMTVREWLDLIEENPRLGFTAEGTEFIPDLERVGSLATA